MRRSLQLMIWSRFFVSFYGCSQDAGVAIFSLHLHGFPPVMSPNLIKCIHKHIQIHLSSYVWKFRYGFQRGMLTQKRVSKSQESVKCSIENIFKTSLANVTATIIYCDESPNLQLVHWLCQFILTLWIVTHRRTKTTNLRHSVGFFQSHFAERVCAEFLFRTQTQLSHQSTSFPGQHEAVMTAANV